MLSWVLCVPGTSPERKQEGGHCWPPGDSSQEGAAKGDLFVTVFSSVRVHPSSLLPSHPSFSPSFLSSSLPLSVLFTFSKLHKNENHFYIKKTVDSGTPLLNLL